MKKKAGWLSQVTSLKKVSFLNIYAYEEKQ